jgi:hypothetical protein
VNVSDPLALVALEAGLITNPLQDKAAGGNSQLDTQQRAAVIGEPVPLVFCRRDEAGGTGGVLISPPATEARFSNNSSNDVTASYHLVLSEGRIGSIQVRDVFQRSCRVGSFTQTYDRRAGTWAPGNFITDVNTGYRRFFTTESFILNTQSRLDKYNAILTSTLTDPADLANDPYDLISDWDEATLTNPAAPEKNSSWNYGTGLGRTLIKDIKPTSYVTPEASFYCGSIGTYTGLSTLSFTVTIPNGFDQWNRQVHCFVRNGIEVPRLIEGTTGSSNNFADLTQWALVNCAKLPTAVIDTTALTAAANFVDVNNFNCDIEIKQSQNLSDFLAAAAPYFLLAETRNGGKRGLRPLLPVNNDHTIKTTAISWVYTFTEEHILPGSFEISYIPLVDRKPFCVQALWRQQLTDDFGILRTSEVRYPGEAEDGPFEQHDLSAFCTREDHAVKVAAYIRAKRQHTTHALRFRLRPVDLNVTLAPGSIVRVKVRRSASGMNSRLHDYLYEVTRIAESVAGETTLELMHFPIDDQGRSLVALDVASTTGTGILLTSTKSGVSCDVNSSADTSVPAETFTAGSAIDQVVSMPTPQPEDGDGGAPPAADTGEPRTAALYFYSVEWDDLELVVKLRIAPTGVAAVEGLGALQATIENGTVVAVDANGVALNPQPQTLPSLNFTGTVAQMWSQVSEPNKPARPPADRVFQGEFRIQYATGDFPSAGRRYEMPITITGTSGGFDQVTILNSGLAVFNSNPVNLLLLHFDGANNSTSIVDSGTYGLTVVAEGNAKISTASSKFGGAAGRFDASSQNTLFTTTDSQIAIGAADFTLEFWIRLFARAEGSRSVADQVVSFCDPIGDFGVGWEFSGVEIYSNQSATTYFLGWSNFYNDQLESARMFDIELSFGTWYHIAAVRQDGIVKLYANGVHYAEGSIAVPAITKESICIGGVPETVLDGYIDELRLRVGEAVYTSNFTPPTAPFS